MVQADYLNNQASVLLANGDILLSGSTLNNQSYQSGAYTEYAVFNYIDGVRQDATNPYYGHTPVAGTAKTENSVHYVLAGHTTETTSDDSYRSVIQAGGNVTANFSQDISNTNATANAGRISNTLNAPTLNTLNQQTIGGAVEKQALSAGDKAAVNSPEWQDNLQNALQQINGGSGLDNVTPELTGLGKYSDAGQGSANLGMEPRYKTPPPMART